MKKLSIAATAACVVKHIPELEKEVENLVQRKEELLSRMSRQREDYDDYHVGKRRKAERNETSSSAAVIISSVGGEEVVVQISALKAADKGILSEALNKRELDDKLVLINASSFQSIGDRVFHSLHFQADGKYDSELLAIKRKIMSLFAQTRDRSLEF